MQTTIFNHQFKHIDIVALSEIQFEQWQPLWQGYQQFYQVQLSDKVSKIRGQN